MEENVKQHKNKSKKGQAHSKMLNNLLGISSMDNAVCSSSKIYNFDLASILSKRNIAKVNSQNHFVVKIEKPKDIKAIQKLSDSLSFDEFVGIAQRSGIILSESSLESLRNKFSHQKAKIVAKLLKKESEFIAKWKKFRNNYLDKQVQTNAWPLYIGTMFIKAKLNRTSVYAPFALKKVKINITKKNDVEIESIDDDVEINEKLLFLLSEEYKINIPKLKSNHYSTIDEFVEGSHKFFAKITLNDLDISGNFDPLLKAEIANSKPEFVGGSALMVLSPSGGELRNKLVKMVENDELDNLLKFDASVHLPKQIDEELILQKSVFRIEPTDISQELALLASQKDSIIIWGPPGTGKSQTIANIVANLLVDKKRVIITSEKKAALDVLIERMGVLKKYIFFGLTDKNMNKKDFYAPLQELMAVIKDLNASQENEPGFLQKPLISSSEKNYFSQVQYLKGENTDALAKLHNYFADDSWKPKLQSGRHFLTDLKQNKDIVLDSLVSMDIDQALEKNGIQKSGFGLFKQYPLNIQNLEMGIQHFGFEKDLLESICELNDLKNIDLSNEFIKVEKLYKDYRHDFESDANYIDGLMAQRFANKLQSMLVEQNPMSTNAKLFVKACEAGFLLPYKFISKHKDVINELFDVFVSTPNMLASIISFEDEFDYAIFDEASQLHIEKAIPFLGIAKRSIIAGDSKQMQPTDYFEIRDREEETDEITEFDKNPLSLLEFAYGKGMKDREFMLNKNYRSLNSELMLFSSKHFYEEKLDIINSKKLSISKSIEVYEVDGVWEKRVNEKEANMALEVAIKYISKYKKIILLTLNASQKRYIDELVYKEHKFSKLRNALESGQLILRNLENIQGDEADLVIVSVAYDKNTSLGSTYVARPEGKNALNVAISRAKEKMIVLKSIKSSEIKTSKENDSLEIFKNWVEYLEYSSDERKNYCINARELGHDYDSLFKKEVFDFIEKNISTKRKVDFNTDFVVGTFSVDIALRDSETKEFVLGIEIAEYKDNSGAEQMVYDIEHRRFIESKGYPIYQVMELEWKTDKDQVIKEIEILANSLIWEFIS